MNKTRWLTVGLLGSIIIITVFGRLNRKDDRRSEVDEFMKNEREYLENYERNQEDIARLKIENEGFEIFKKLHLHYGADRLSLYNGINAFDKTGQGKWSFLYPDEFKDQKNVLVIQGDAESVKGKTIVIQAFVNLNTKQMKLIAAKMDDKPMAELEVWAVLGVFGGGLN